MSGEVKADGFPTEGIMPKAETQALSFLRANPAYDGRNVVVAILDTGVDPGAIGLQETSDGKPKIVDIVDTTGSGDLDTSKVVEGKAEEGCVLVKGVTGKPLKLSSGFKNPTGKWHVGAKPEFELYPKGLKNRIVKEKAKKFLEPQRKRLAELARKIAVLEESERKGGGKERGEGGKGGEAKGPAPASSPSAAAASTPRPEGALEDLKEQKKQLEAMVKSFSYTGRVFDVVTWHDGEKHVCVVDTQCDGDLTSSEPMANYRHSRQYGTIDTVDLVNYSVNIYDDGNLTTIVVCCGSHGTHVAGITAAYLPDEKGSMDGVAPGAQIVSVKIGDTRLGSMETNMGMVRAVRAIIDNKCDLVNMSYGEPTSTPNKGRFPELCALLVNTHNVIFVSSAGNAGPALTTVGAPGSTTSELIGVGAYVSTPMMKAEYCMRGTDTVADIQYTWSSRGPCANGHLGVCISAPGGAIAPVPQWTLRRNTLMNGTSMASPNACGGLALVLSGLKALGVPYTPHSVRRACENTAKYIGHIERFAQGHGLLQVDDCFKALSASGNRVESRINYKVAVGKGAGWVAGGGGGRGVYLRNPKEVEGVSEATADVTPAFHEDEDPKLKQGFQQRLLVRPTAFWVDAPKYILLMNGGRSFSFAVDPSELGPGAHYAEVQGFDSTDLSKGPLFRVPVTAIKPEKKQDKEGRRYRFRDLSFKPGHIERRYLATPEGCTLAHIKLTTSNAETTRKFMVAAVYLDSQRGYRDNEINKFVASENQEHHFNMPVEPGVTLEVVVAQYWSSLGVCTADLDVSFHGVSPTPSVLFVTPNAPNVTRVDLRCGLGKEKLDAQAKLTSRVQQYRPKEAIIRPLPPAERRDLLPKQTFTSELLATYQFELKAKTSKVKIGFPFLNKMLYDSPYGSQLFMLFDEAKRHVATGDAWPDAVSLDKGKYTVRLHVRHDDVGVLEGLRALVMDISMPLSKPVSLSAHPSYADAALKRSKLGGNKTIKASQTIPVFFSAPTSKAVEGLAPGTLLTGSVTYIKSRDGMTDVRSYPVRGVVPPAAAPAAASASSGGKKKAAEEKKKKKEEEKGEEGKEAKPKEDPKAKFDEMLLKARAAAILNYVSTLKGDELKEALPRLKELKESTVDDGDDVPRIFNAKPTNLSDLKSADEKIVKEVIEAEIKAHAVLEDHAAVIAAADEYVRLINPTELAAFFGVNRSDDDDKAETKAKEKDRKGVIAALTAKAKAVVDQLTKAVETANKGKAEGETITLSDLAKDQKEGFVKALKELKRWTNVKKDKKVLSPLILFEHKLNGCYGKALSHVSEHIASNPRDKAMLATRSELLKVLGWTEWIPYYETSSRINFPYAYRTH